MTKLNNILPYLILGVLLFLFLRNLSLEKKLEDYRNEVLTYQITISDSSIARFEYTIKTALDSIKIINKTINNYIVKSHEEIQTTNKINDIDSLIDRYYRFRPSILFGF